MSSLAKGIFWIKDINNVENSIIHLGVFVDTCGNIDLEVYDVKEDKEFNYKKIWKSLNKEITEGKSYDYFLHGRVTVANNKLLFMFLLICLTTKFSILFVIYLD